MISFDLCQLLQAVNIEVLHASTDGGLDVGAQLGGVVEDEVLGGVELHQLRQLLFVGEVESHLVLAETVDHLSSTSGSDI